MTTTTVTTTAPVKSTKKAAAAPKLSAAAKLTTMIVDGVTARLGGSFYKSALAYHKKAGTVFPRPRVQAAAGALTEADVQQVFELHDKGVLASGNVKGQAVFDAYMVATGS